MKNIFRKLIFIGLVGVIFLSGCGGSSGSSSSRGESESLNVSLATIAVEDWAGFDYSAESPDGLTDTDSDGDIDANAAVVVIESFAAMGLALPETTIAGLYQNKYAEAGYAATDSEITSGDDFPFTVATDLTQDDLINLDWDKLAVGDLIFIDFDKDSTWDIVGIYVGSYEEMTHTLLIGDLLDDEISLVDLDSNIIVQLLDFESAYSEIRRPDYANIIAINQRLRQ